MKLQQAVKKETGYVAISTAAGCVVMLAVFFLLNRVKVLGNVPFGASEIVSALIGWFVASLNFFLMAISVQKVAGIADQKKARSAMTVSYRYRTILQVAWAAVSILVPFFNPAAGIIPLFIPSIMIKLRGIGSHQQQHKGSKGKEVKA